MPENSSQLRSMTAEIATSYINGNELPLAELPALINRVYETLSGLENAAHETRKAEPAVPINKSVQHDAILCLCCGKKLSMLKRHIQTHHGMTVQEYRAYWGLSSGYPKTAPAYVERRSVLAKKIGLGKSGKSE